MPSIDDATEPDTPIGFLGKQLDLPVLAAPIGGVSFNMGGQVSNTIHFKIRQRFSGT
jgi:hypothetical protein